MIKQSYHPKVDVHDHRQARIRCDCWQRDIDISRDLFQVTPGRWHELAVTTHQMH